ncbi:DUF4231 domain-containing protein [Lichenibacterium dinghuense]|uniref:DUF4231 domain-containing protein n=1 Tax=Lichenibacterium dinghuense TaxID=2895977 RepID=UPI0021036CF7|nr:DUF4231 domain-containing protein [Lichenibacterium sp. 6Y81]
MKNLAWDEYRGWAKRARTLQASSMFWNRSALICICASALCAACSATLGESNGLGSILSASAALLAAVGAFVGRNILAQGDEPNWLQARATAEGLRSECYKYAAQVGAYGGAEALLAFQAARTALQEKASEKGLSSLPDDVRGDDPRAPPDGMTMDWYLTNRIGEQRIYYDEHRARNESGMHVLQAVTIMSGLIAVLFGVLIKTSGYALAPWITTVTTVSTAIIAYGLLDRRKYLIASYAATASCLRRLEELARSGAASLPDLVTRTEDMLQGEHRAWLDHTMQMVAKSPVIAANPKGE